MPDTHLSSEEQQALWQLARERLALKKLKPTISAQLAQQLRAQLLSQQENETLGDLIRRSSSHTSAEIKPFKPKSFQTITEFIRLAAESDDANMPLPETGSTLESTDGQFRLIFCNSISHVEITIEALGYAADQFANCCIGLLDADDNDHLIAQFNLDQDGDGHCKIKDTLALRRALLKPLIVLIE